MKNNQLKRQLLKKKLLTKSRLIILNEDSFEEIFSVRLTLMNVFVGATLGAFAIIFVTTFIIAFTPLREYIPGYASNDLRKDALELAYEGNRWEDLVRVALRRNDPAFLADKVYDKLSKEGNSNASAVRSKLMNVDNWYLPFNW